MIKWLWDRTLAFNRHPAYPVGLILDMDNFGEIGTIVNRKWSNKRRRWLYEIDDYGTRSESDVTNLLGKNGYLDVI